MNKKRTNIRENIKSYALISPYLLIFTVFSVLPVLVAIFFGFTDFNVLESPRFVGLDNYIRMFSTDDVFFVALKNTLGMAVVIGPGGDFLSLFVAWRINELSDRLRPIITFLFYAPSISGTSISCGPFCSAEICMAMSTVSC